MAEIGDETSEIPTIFEQMRSEWKKGNTRSNPTRKQALKAIMRGLQEMVDDFRQALAQDLGYNKFMSDFAGLSTSIGEIKHLIANFQSWTKPQSVPTNLAIGMASSSIQYQPLGLVLVISAWNYPLYTALPEVAAAICAGNSVILKPSELAPYTSNAIKKMFDKYLDPRNDFVDAGYYRVIEGKVQTGKLLTQLPFDLICFTGSTQTGRFVAIEAAKNLTPCLLQLGGKCPVILDQTCKMQSAVMKVLFGKYFNCGQTCVGADHVYVHELRKKQFKQMLLKKTEQFYGSGQNLAEEGYYGKIINAMHINRLQKLLIDKHEGQVIYGGQIDKDKRYISPTIIQSPSKNSLMMKQEIFGPILPLFYYTDLQAVIQEINQRDKPLVFYMFSESSTNINNAKHKTSSGSFIVNDCIIQMSNADLPFGGVGKSGHGRYHGKSGFVNFSNAKSICLTKALTNFPINQRFPPYTANKQKNLNMLFKFGSITYNQIGKCLLLMVILIIAATLAGVFISRS